MLQNENTTQKYRMFPLPLDTVAGDASRIFSISRSNRIGGVSGIRSLLANVRVLLSSMTCDEKDFFQQYTHGSAVSVLL